MHSVDVFDAPEIENMSTAVVHGVRFFEALLAKPDRDLEVRDDGSSCSLSDFDRVGDVIVVTVGNKDVIRSDRFDFDTGCQWIRFDERIEEEDLARGLHREAGVAVVGKLHCEGVDFIEQD